MTMPNPTFGPVVDDRAALSAALGVGERDLVDGLPVQMVTCGVPFLYAPLSTRKVVDSVSIDRKGLARCVERAGLGELPVFIFSLEKPNGASETVYSRMLAPGFGISEDPATGSASGPLGSYLVHYRAVPPEGAHAMVSLQGVAMRRPSRIHMSIETRDGSITRVRVGGKAVLVGRGELSAPDSA
jgi:trans-2,3-dihydro-3-hydroxyanthranilate isomerase